VSPKWLSITMNKIVGDDQLSACYFDYNWRRRFYARFNLATRKRTNKKSPNMEQRMIKWSSYHEHFRAFMRSGPLQCSKYGRYSPENRYMFFILHALLVYSYYHSIFPNITLCSRYNVDQVPLPFVFAADATIEEKGMV
jgi:hypothetical protein